jgi:hypothetical protein
LRAVHLAARRPLAFGCVHRQIARHENRDLHYPPDYLLLTPVGGAVSFTLKF